METISQSATAPTRPRRARLEGSIIAVTLAGVCTFLDVYPTQALLPSLRRVFNASEIEISLTVSATTLAVALAAPFIGMLAERIGRKRVIVPALFALCVPTTMAATATSLHALILWRFAQGLCIPGIIAVMMAYIGEEWPATGVGFAMSAYVSGTVLGGFLGRFSAGQISNHFGWRWAFVFLGVLTLAGAIAVSRLLPPSTHFVPSRNAAATLRAGLSHFSNVRMVATFAMGFCMLFTLVGTLTYANFHMANPPYRLNAAQLGSVFIIYLLGLIVTPTSGRYLDHHGFRKTILLAYVLALLGLALTLVASLPVIIVGLALLSSGMFVFQSTASTQVGIVAGHARSSAAGLYVTFYYAGGSLGAIVPGWFWIRGGWPATVAVLAISPTCAVLLGFLSSRAREAAPQHSDLILPLE
jgi:predicted MFS family arabinose efflux permease